MSRDQIRLPCQFTFLFSTFLWAEYTNRLNKTQAVKLRDLGVSALQEALLHWEAGMLEDIKDRTR